MALSFNTSLNTVSLRFLELLKLKINRDAFSEVLNSNPYFPSLLSLSDTMEWFGIKNKGARILPNELELLEPPFIAYMHNQKTDTDFVVVEEKSADKIVYYSDRRVVSTTKDFIRDWEGVVFIADNTIKRTPRSFSKSETSYKRQNRTKTIGAVLLSILYLVLVGYQLQKSQEVIHTLFTLLIKTFGVAVAILLLSYEMNKSNSFIKSICTAGKKTSCDAVLSSSGSKFLGMTWSEVGFYYFCSTLIFLLAAKTGQTNALNFLSFLSYLTCLYIPYSIYYQYAVVKNWCPLCVFTQILLLLEAVIHIIYARIVPYSLLDVFADLAIFSIIGLGLLGIWLLIQPILKNANDYSLFKYAYKRLLYNPSVFETMLMEQDNITSGYEDIGINIGEEYNQNLLIKVCNPYCKPCSESHHEVEDLLDRANNVRLKIVYLVPDIKEDESKWVVNHFMALYDEMSAVDFQAALFDWYRTAEKDFSEFAAKYPINHRETDYTQIVNTMREWCTSVGITHTPTYFLNGKRIPYIYGIDDLKHVLS